MALAPARDEDRIVLPLLRWLRWAVVLALGVGVAAGPRWLELPVAFGRALPALGLLAAVALWGSLPAPRALPLRVLTLSVALDVVGVALVLSASGGPANPLSALLFVHVALAAALLPARHAHAVAVLATLAFGSLFALDGAPCPAHEGGPAFQAHLYGMWASFGLGAVLVAYFVSRVRAVLAEREAEIALLRQQAAESARFAALGTLAAGAAHELGTPLGTIHVLAGELESDKSDEASRVGSVIREQVDRCREVLGRMRPGHGRSTMSGAALDVVALTAVERWRAAHPHVGVTLAHVPSAWVSLSPDDLDSVLGVLLDNALDAAGPHAPITVEGALDQGEVVLRVRDEGPGLAPELVGRVGEPFVTTKEPGAGMGLGLYLVRSLLESVGARLVVASSQGGAIAELRFAASLAEGAPSHAGPRPIAGSPAPTPPASAQRHFSPATRPA